ncbi:MAG: biotin transporter BioY [Actinomycetales bacterium]|nr:biotin transporter BioY [Actinomycetales bacterium]
MSLAVAQPRVLADALGTSWVRQVALVAGAAGFTGLCAQIAFYLPSNPLVPVTMQTFAVLVVGGALGALRGASAIALYVALGVAGVPWFAERSSGFAMPSFGYILGFILAALIVGSLAQTGASRRLVSNFGLMILGSLVIYLVGATWLKYSTGLPWFGAESAWTYGVRDFLIGDAIKILLATATLPIAWRIVNRVQRQDDPS